MAGVMNAHLAGPAARSRLNKEAELGMNHAGMTFQYATGWHNWFWNRGRCDKSNMDRWARQKSWRRVF